MGKVDKFKDLPDLPLPAHALDTGEDRKVRAERVNVCFPVYATIKGNLIQGFIESVNLSWSGMRIATNFPLNIDDRISLEFTLPGTGIPIKAAARVVHKLHETSPEQPTSIGLAFEEMEPNVQRMIAGFVLEHLPDY